MIKKGLAIYFTKLNVTLFPKDTDKDAAIGGSSHYGIKTN